MTTQDRDALDRTFPRREALVLLAGVGGAAIWRISHGPSGIALAARTPAAASAASCLLTPEATEGPYYIPNHLTRRNVTVGRPGLPLALHLKVENAASCRPIAGADVEIWHADAGGVYSGFSPVMGPGPGSAVDNSKRFLRGHQRSNAHGNVVFDTIYPGWYRGRAPHIHIKVHVGGAVVHTGQLFFADRISDAVYRTTPYKSHGQPDTPNSADSIYASAGGGRAQLHLGRRASGKGYAGAITLGVR